MEKKEKEYVALLIRKGKKILLVRERNGLWGPPGGHIEPGESIFQAALREGREETGLPVTFTHGWIGAATVVEIFNTSTSRGIIFEGEVAGREEVGVPESEEIIEVRWFTQEEIHTLFAEGLLRNPRWNIRFLVDKHTNHECDYLYNPETYFSKENLPR